MPTVSAPCRMCGETFEYQTRKGKAPLFCGKLCRDRYRRHYHQAWQQERAPRSLVVRCKTCGATVERKLSDVGQPKQYCGPKCRQRYHVVEQHGLGDGKYAALLESQGHLCAICGTDTPGGPRGRGFVIDHCHVGGHVRGLLCDHCNRGLGLFRDNPSILRSAAEYIERNAHAGAQASG